MPFVDDVERTVEMQTFDGFVHALRKINVNQGYSVTVASVDEIPRGPFNPELFPSVGAYMRSDMRQRREGFNLEEMTMRVAAEGWLQARNVPDLRPALMRYKADIYRAVLTDLELNDPTTGPCSRADYAGCLYFLSDAADNEGGVVVEFALAYRHVRGNPYGFTG